MLPNSRYLSCAGYEIHYTDWGAPDAPVVVAWHGLARTGRDMDELASHLSSRYRVICPDTIGRGLSQWSRQPEQDYCLRFYARIACELFDGLDIRKAHWVGTSMGGAIGTVCASGLLEPSMKDRILSLTLNDNAPELAAAAIGRIREYAGNPPAFETVGELEAFFRGAGWNVIKVVWGRGWDDLLKVDVDGALVKLMNTTPDGDFQTYKAESGAYIRENFFGRDPRALELVKDYTDEQIWNLQRGGHDYRKVYAAYKAAMEHKGQPTVILAHTVKGYGLGPHFEGRNATHQMKKMTLDDLKLFRDTMDIPVTDAQLE